MKQAYPHPARCLFFGLLMLCAFTGNAQWVQQGPELSEPGFYGFYAEGGTIALSPDGNTAAVGFGVDSGCTTGGFFIFRKTAGLWVQQARIDLHQMPLIVVTGLNPAVFSADGNTLVINQVDYDSTAVYTCINGVWKREFTFQTGIPYNGLNPYNDIAISYGGNVIVSGATIYNRVGHTYVQQARLIPYDRPVTDTTNGFSLNCTSNISADGKTVVIGDTYQADNTTCAWVFVNNAGTWQQQLPRLEGTGSANTSNGAQSPVVLSGDGNTIAIGDISYSDYTGPVWIFKRNANVWTEPVNHAQLLNNSTFGCSRTIKISFDGNTIIKGSPTGIGFFSWHLTNGVWTGLQHITSPTSTSGYENAQFQQTLIQGVVNLAIDSSGTAVLLGYNLFDASAGGVWYFTSVNDTFYEAAPAFSLSGITGIYQSSTSAVMSADGSTIAAGNEYDNAGNGSVWVYTQRGGAWKPLGNKITPPGSISAGHNFRVVSLSADGSILAVGAPNSNNPSSFFSNGLVYGNIYIYNRSGQNYVPFGDTITNPTHSGLGSSLVLSADGKTLLAGTADSGALVYFNNGSGFTLQGVLNTGYNQGYGAVLALSGDGNTAAVGNTYYDNFKGTVLVFTRTGNTWALQDTVKPASLVQNNAFPHSLSLSYNGNLLAEGIGVNNVYEAYIFRRSNGSWAAPDSVRCSGSIIVSYTGDTIVTNFNGFNVFTYTGNQWINGPAVHSGYDPVNLPSSIIGSSDLKYLAASMRDTLQTFRYYPIVVFKACSLIDSLVLNKPANCPQSATGKISVQLRGGTAPYHYYWSNGAPDAATANNLLPGIYTLTLTDAVHDTLVRQYTINTLHQPVNGNYLTTYNCGTNLGSIAVQMTGGTLPYRYVWGTVPVQLTDTAVALAPGSYAYTATDAVGCVYSDTAVLTAINYWASAGAGNIICGQAGVVKATMYGTAPYSYSWSNAQTTDSIITSTAGSYTVTVTDANQCTATASAVLSAYCGNIINGRVFFDRNNNCIQDGTEKGAYGLTMIATNGSYTVFGNTDSMGNYSIETPGIGNFTVSIAHWQQCSYPVCTGSSYPPVINLNSLPDTVNNINIALVNPGIDLAVQALAPCPFPGSAFDYTTYYGNLQDSVLPTGQLSIIYDSLLVYAGTSVPYQTLDTIHHIVTFSLSQIGSLYPLQAGITVHLQIPVTVLPQTVLYMQSAIMPDSSDCNPVNNHIIVPVYVAGSLDPNFKIAYPANTLPLTDSVITYTIHFQNTGVGPTHFVQVLDTLLSGFDPSSVVTLSTSALPYTFSIVKQGILCWLFNPLALPDSASDPAGSQGYITFSVKIKEGLAPGTELQNTAAIYFDYNAPVITNTAFNVYQALCTVNYDTLTQTICIGDTVRIGSFTHATTGIYTDTLTATTGCDSIIKLTLNVLAATYDSISTSICTGDTFKLAGHFYTQPGTFTDTLLNASGCDSLITLTLMVNTASTITFSWDTLIAQHDVLQTYFPPGVAWCSPDFGNPETFMLAGATPAGGTYSGRYITNNVFRGDSLPPYYMTVDTITYTYGDSANCPASTTIVLQIDICEGINQISDNNAISIYPNPTTGKLQIQTYNLKAQTIVIYDLDGRRVLSQPFTTELNVNQLSSGVYFIEVKSKELTARKRFVKM